MISRFSLLLGPTWLCLFTTVLAQSMDKGFRNPPDSANPYTWWHWVDENVSKEGITKDLEAMKAVGIGSYQLFDAGLPADPGPDGVNLIPFLSGESAEAPHSDLFWRFWGQSSVRSGRWKLLIAGEDKYLFDLESDEHENTNLLAKHPEIARKLEVRLRKWASDLDTLGLPTDKFNPEEKGWYDHYMSE